MYSKFRIIETRLESRNFGLEFRIIFRIIFWNNEELSGIIFRAFSAEKTSFLYSASFKHYWHNFRCDDDDDEDSGA